MTTNAFHHEQLHATGEDTALAPLLPELMAALHGEGGLDAAAIARVGRTYEARMRAAAQRHRPAAMDASAWPQRIVDKMLRNSWNLGYASIMLPRAVVRPPGPLQVVMQADARLRSDQPGHLQAQVACL